MLYRPELGTTPKNQRKERRKESGITPILVLYLPLAIALLAACSSEAPQLGNGASGSETPVPVAADWHMPDRNELLGNNLTAETPVASNLPTHYDAASGTPTPQNDTQLLAETPRPLITPDPHK